MLIIYYIKKWILGHIDAENSLYVNNIIDLGKNLK